MYVSYLHFTSTGRPSGVMMPGVKGLDPANLSTNLRKIPQGDPSCEANKESTTMIITVYLMLSICTGVHTFINYIRICENI